MARSSKKKSGNKKSNAKGATSPTARISGKFEGNISASGNLQIARGASCNANIRAAAVDVQGQFNGTMRTRTGMRVGSNANCRGSFSTKWMQVEGAMEGEVFVQDCVAFTPTAAVRGDLIASRLIVADGASFEGRVSVGKFAAARTKKAA
jgi:cytoskeletal protein CcmA (bactofilin family)